MSKNLIKEKFIPYMVTEALKDFRPISDDEFVDFTVTLYDEIKIMEKKLEANIKIKN